MLWIKYTQDSSTSLWQSTISVEWNGGMERSNDSDTCEIIFMVVHLVLVSLYGTCTYY